MEEQAVAGMDPFTIRDEAAVEVNAIPNNGLQVTAAALSLLQPDDQAALKDYQDTMGREPSAVPAAIQQKIAEQNKRLKGVYSEALLPLLGDSKVPFEQKQSAVVQAQKGFNDPDPIDTLVSEALIAPSAGESVQGEAVRASIIDSMGSVNNYYRELQEIENSVKSDQNQSSVKLLNLFELFLPGEAGLMAGKVAKGLYGDSSITAAAALLPGSARKQLSDAIKNMPLDARIEFVQQLAPIVASSSGILTDKNQLQINTWLTEVARGDVSATEKWVDNIFNVIDLTGIGKLITSGPKAAIKLAAKGKAALAEGEAANRARFAQYVDRSDPEMTARQPAEPIPGVTGEASITTKPELRTNLEKLNAAEAEKADLLGATSGKLDNGQVDNLRKERKILERSLKTGGLTQKELRVPGAATAAVDRAETIKAQMKRIDDQLAANSGAAKAEQRIAELEKNIEALRKDLTTAPAELNSITQAIRRTELNSVVGFSNPRTPATVLENHNPERARNLYAQVYFQDDSFAQAVSGSPKTEMIMKSLLPQVDDGTGVVRKVVDNKEGSLKEAISTQMGMAVENTFGGFAYTEAEIAKARAAKVNDYSTVSGMKINDAMSSFGVSEDGVTMHIRATYTNGEGGWLRAEDAVNQAKVSLRKQGILESEIEVLRREGSNYVPVKFDEVKGVDGDFVVQIKVTDELYASEIKDWDNLDVKRNLFDYFETKGENTWGSINRHFVDAASSVHKQITGSLTLADDKAARLSAAFTEMFETTFSNPYMKLDAKRRKDVDSYIREANVKELKFDRNALRNRFNDQELDVIQGWRDSWDIMWEFENYDLVRSLINDRFQLLDHPNLRAVVRERPKRYDNRTVYDPDMDAVRKLSDAEIDNIYTNGGNISEFRRPIDVDGQEVSHVLIKQTSGNYSRKLREDDKMLEYRDGYYQVFYKHPQFIEETEPGKTSRVISVVGNIKDAKKTIEDLQKQFPDRSYTRRGDDRGIDRSRDAYWDMQHVGGRLAQRHRGELLENSVGLKSMGDVQYIESPADSAVRAAQSIGGRLAMRETLDVAKRRFMSQYESVLPKENGITVFPSNRGQIRQKGAPTNTKLADARTTWEYIRSVENGYINALDTTVKNAFNYMAEVAGAKGYDTVEKLARAGEDINITGTVKGGVFASMIATNPLRQFIVQPNQALRMSAYNPGGFFSGRVMAELSGEIFNRVTKKDYIAPKGSFGDWIRETGVEQAITRGNLIRGTMLDAADSTNAIGKAHDRTVGAVRKIGYDKAEQLNLLTHGAFVFDKYKQAGRDVTNARVREEMHAELRHLTGNMNLAGDMPYNQNVLALLFTYMQVPHKFVMMPFNRHLPVDTRMRLLAADLAIWGLPIGLISQAAGVDLPIENEWMREALEDGLQAVTLNAIASSITGERQKVDYSSLEPFGLDSWTKMFDNFMFDGATKGMIENTPTARVFGLSSDSRLGAAVKATASYFQDLFQIQTTNPYTSADLLDVANSWASMSSGWTNFQKARAAWMFGKMRDKLGRATDDDVTKWEAINQLFGFGTQDTVSFYETMKLSNKKDGETRAKDDMEAWTKMIMQASNGDPRSEKALRMYSQLMASTGWMPDKEEHRKYLSRIREGWVGSANEKVRRKLFDEVINVPRPDIMTDPIKDSSLTPEEKQSFVKTRQMHLEQFQKYQAMAEKELKKD